MAPIPELEAIRKRQIFEAALTTIAALGSANVTMADICQAAGLSKGGLAHYYKSKRELFMYVFEEFFKRIFERGSETMERFNDPLDRLLSFVWLYNPDDPDVSVGYPLLFDFMSIAVRDAEVREIFAQWIQNWLSLLKSSLEMGQSQGKFMELDADEAARAISAIYQGIATRWVLAPELHSAKWAVDTLKRVVTAYLNSNEEKNVT